MNKSWLIFIALLLFGGCASSAPKDSLEGFKNDLRSLKIRTVPVTKECSLPDSESVKLIKESAARFKSDNPEHTPAFAEQYSAGFICGYYNVHPSCEKTCVEGLMKQMAK
ncbi:MAG TPA: hypothetical protein PL048_02410 [Leptospiraceae bacterium]|nr:hypothetical protein [Leptospiraceae bacterium]HMY68800.1 hypothetical protein [Leptospiraceae bacterium]HMZ57598.1 hypothetical protein [Leptospiraceae bacterium]HNF14809.1 hypothetical protein [Leptospiraceae bacterium]HNF28466.1 hypothetical protein [Leptospiraceae bacterium]